MDAPTPPLPADGTEDAPAPPPSGTPPRPESIGPYRIFGLLGEGGMGVVYLAQQTEPVERRVALKVIKAGMDTHRVVARFESERQALAMMDHPGIAKVLDAGRTESGRPYFAMEHVPGAPVTEYCDKARLSTDDRLRLFLEVCEAAQHAHQKGVIHRDLKPSNILVAEGDGRARPKIIDFGVAKATDRQLSREAFTTEHGGLVGTPEYMSPEQATGGILDVDTRSDIYSLGVVLYELLTGRLPFQIPMDAAPMDEVRRRIREEEPARPSTALTRHGESAERVARLRRTDPATLARRLRGDLDWIVMKALEKDPDRRYGTASALAADIERHLGDEPVLAGPPGPAYRARKFVRKHRFGVLTSVVFVAGLIVAVATTTWQSVRMQRQRDAATLQERAAHSRELALQAINRTPTDPELALLLAIEAVEVAPTEEGEDALRQAYLAGHTRSVLRGHTGPVGDVEIDPTGRRVVSASRDGTARVWDLDSGRERAVLPGHGNWVTAATFSPDGSRIATSGADQTARIWDAETAEELAVCRGHEFWFADVEFAPDGSSIVTGDDGGDAHVWDPVTGEELARLDGGDGGIYRVRHGPDGRWIAIGGKGAAVHVYDARSHRRAHVLELDREWVSAIEFDPGGRWIAVSAGGREIRLYSLESGERLRTLDGHQPGVLDVALAADGARLASAGRDRSAKIWDLATGKATAILLGHSASVWRVAFSPDGARVITGGGDGRLGYWSSDTGDHLAWSGGHSGQILDLGFTPDGSTIVTASSDGTLRTWDHARSTEHLFLRQDPRPVHAATFSPDGGRIATVSENSVTRIWDSRTGAILHGVIPGSYTGPQVSVQFHPSEDLVLLSGWDGDLLLLEAHRDGAIAVLRGHEGMSRSARFDAEGRRIISGGDDGTARLWSVERREEVGVLRGHEGPVRCGVFSPDGALVATGGDDGTVRLWDAVELALLAVLEGHEGPVRSLGFDGSGSTLLSASLDGTARLWDVADRRVRSRIDGRSLGLTGAAFSPDGRHILTSGRDGTTRMWDASTGAAVALLRGHTDEVSAAEFDPAGERIVTASADGSVRVVPASIFCPLDEMLRRARARTTRELTAEERRRFLHDESAAAGGRSKE